MWNAILQPEFFATILRMTTPILFATLAASIAAKSGITNMALEGIMLFSALFGVIFSSVTHSAFLGILLTMLLGGFLGLILAFFVLNLKTDEILAAIAINLTATGGTVLLLVAVSGDRGVSSSIRSVSAPAVTLPLIDKIPFIGQVLSGQNILTWLSLLAVVLMHLFLYKTPLGLSIRAVG
ncbi:MAG: ABC transporter permease, partial [Eubacteriales bacterium]|nr:ABC transporter permease [Eubacteriales bacterium]